MKRKILYIFEFIDLEKHHKIQALLWNIIFKPKLHFGFGIIK